MGKYKQFVFHDAAHGLLSNFVWWLAHPNEGCELLVRCWRRFGRRPVTLWTIAGTFGYPGLHVANANYAHADWASCKFSGEGFRNCHIGEFCGVVRTRTGRADKSRHRRMLLRYGRPLLVLLDGAGMLE